MAETLAEESGIFSDAHVVNKAGVGAPRGVHLPIYEHAARWPNPKHGFLAWPKRGTAWCCVGPCWPGPTYRAVLGLRPRHAGRHGTTRNLEVGQVVARCLAAWLLKAESPTRCFPIFIVRPSLTLSPARTQLEQTNFASRLAFPRSSSLPTPPAASAPPPRPHHRQRPPPPRLPAHHRPPAARLYSMIHALHL